MAIYLRQWATEHGIALSTAYRWFAQGTLPEGVRAYRTSSGSILVDSPQAEDPLDSIDIHALVDRLHAAGYVVLTTEQADRLGLHADTGKDKDTDQETEQ